MELVLIRHGQPVRRLVETGVADPVLSDNGRQQAELLAKYLRAEDFDALYVSPMNRARETAAPLATDQRLSMVVVDGIAEYDRHSPEYIPIEELKAAKDPRYFDSGRPEGAPSVEDFQATVVSAIEMIIDAHPGQKIAAVCHGGVINTYLAYVLSLAQGDGFFYPDYTSINRVVAARSGERQIKTLNETPHLRGTGLTFGLTN